MPDGSTASAPGQSVAPAQSPRLLTSVPILPRTPVYLQSSGRVDLGGNSYPPDGEANVTFHAAGAENGIASITAPAGSLIGVFLDDSQPDSTPAPPALDFSEPTSQNLFVYWPRLKQPFFIGDGNTASGAAQAFIAPAGATRLWLGVMDSNDWVNNAGEFSVVARDRPNCLSFGVANYAADPHPNSIVQGDFDADGAIDLALTHANGVSTLLGNGDGTFQGATNSSPAGAGPRYLVAGNFDLDGLVDVIVANQISDSVSVLSGDGAGMFPSSTHYPVGDEPHWLTVVDLNSDPWMDLVVANEMSDTVSVMLGAAGGFLPRTDYPTDDGPISVTAGDFNGDQKMDVATANFFSASVSVLHGIGDGTFSGSMSIPVGSNPRALVASDFDEDGWSDLVVANESDGTVSVILSSASGDSFTYPVGSAPRFVALADLNGDGSLDLAVANANSNDVSVLVGVSHGAFLPAVNFATGGGAMSIAIGDFNGDGRPDLAVADSTSNDIAVLLNHGACCPDVNCDGAVNGFDVEAMEQAVNGDMLNFCQADPDFNQDGSLNGFDVEAVEQVVNGAPCP
ncbi:hypothetical protein PHYC_00816 [Phycisphaerales bacterium]|nr:hypothetical protein PHYC_00816 [Phycisphaerales bacterium]